MNPDNQTQNPQPDYSFITSQPTPDMPSPKKSHGKLFVIGGLFFTFLILIGVLVATGANKKVVEQSSPSDVVQSHIKLLSENKIADSKEYYANANQINDELYTLTWEKVLSKQFDFSKCKLLPATGDQPANVVKEFCQHRDAQSGQIFVFHLSQSNLIESVNYDAGDKNG